MTKKMRKFRLDKLVRNDIVADHERQGCAVERHVLEGEKLLKAAADKVREEVQEALADEKLEASEVGDCIEALYNLAAVHGISKEEVHSAMEVKNAKKGDFSKGYFITTVMVPADSWFAEYYGADPDRFPELSL